MQKLNNEIREQIGKKFKHWINDIQVLVQPSIVSSLFFATRRSSAAFYNPVVAFKNIHSWLSNVYSQIEKNPLIAQLLTEDIVGCIKHALMITSPQYLAEFKHQNTPIKDINTLYSFLALHSQITVDIWNFYHRITWLLEREFQLEG
jgi:hypothetical protein